MKQLLVIDDSSTFREAIELAGKAHGWEVCAEDKLDKITGWLINHSPSVVLLDWQLPGQQRQRYVELLQMQELTECTLLLSGAMDDARKRFVKDYGLAGIRLKPLDLERFDREIQLPLSQPTKEARLSSQSERTLTLEEFADESPVAIDMLNRDLVHVTWGNKKAQEEPLGSEEHLIIKWLHAEIEASRRGNVRRIDWDGEKGCFFESTLYRSGDNYALTRDWRDKNERPRDHEFLNLEEENPTLENWLQAVAGFLAKRYAISRFRVYKIAPLPHTEGLEDEHLPLVVPEFQSGSGIEPDTNDWLRTGFQQNEIPDIDSALQKGYTPTPEPVHGAMQGVRNPHIPRVQYGESGTFRVLFPVDLDDGQTVALLAMDRRLDHIGALRGFDRAVVDLATRMASDEAGVLNERQWNLMKGLVEDIGRRIAAWLENDEKDRVVEWHKAISKMLISTFADTASSPEMIYDGISQVCTALADKWNEEKKDGKRKISGHVRGITPWPEQDEKGPPVSAWCIAIVDDRQGWQVVAVSGMAYESCRSNGGWVGIPHAIAAQGEPWKAAVIQAFQAWSKTEEGAPCECLGDDMRHQIGSWLGVPMRVEGKTQALMVVHSPHACYFTQFHSQLMEYAAERLLPLLAAALRETRARNAFTAAVMHEVKNESHAARQLMDQVQCEAGETEWAKNLIEIRCYLDELNALGQDTLDIFRVGGGGRIQASGNKKDEGATTTTLNRLLENATLGWRILYEDTKFDIQCPDELATRGIAIPHALDFQRALRVLLHNAFRHGRDWVRVAARLGDKTGGNHRLELTITNTAYRDMVASLAQTSDSAVDQPSASPMIRGRLGLVVARQLATEAGGVLGTLQYKEGEGDSGRAEITLSWPVDVRPAIDG